MIAARLATLENGQAGRGRSSANLQTYSQPEAAAMQNVKQVSFWHSWGVDRAREQINLVPMWNQVQIIGQFLQKTKYQIPPPIAGNKWRKSSIIARCDI